MLVNIVPKTQKVEDVINEMMVDLRGALDELICRKTQSPEGDVIINLLKCPYRNADPMAADAVIYGETNPSKEFDEAADKLLAETARLLGDFGLTIQVATGGIEVWYRRIDGAWAQIQNGRIVDAVWHTGEPDNI